MNVVSIAKPAPTMQYPHLENINFTRLFICLLKEFWVAIRLRDFSSFFGIPHQPIDKAIKKTTRNEASITLIDSSFRFVLLLNSRYAISIIREFIDCIFNNLFFISFIKIQYPLIVLIFVNLSIVLILLFVKMQFYYFQAYLWLCIPLM